MSLTRCLIACIILLVSAPSTWAGEGHNHDKQDKKDQLTIYFDAFATTPNYDSVKALESLKERITKEKPTTIYVNGHADSGEKPSKEKNRKISTWNLSEMRARYVSKWLENGTGTKAAIRTKSFGHTRPASYGNTADSGKLNRRVEVSFSDRAAAVPAVAKTTTFPPGKAPVVTIPEKTHEFDDVMEDAKVVHDFIIKNTGQSTLDILSVKPG